MTTALPTGRLGRALALLSTLALLSLLWLAAFQPLVDLYADHADLLQRQQAIAQTMEGIAATSPALSRQAVALGAAGTVASSVVPGDNDAIAGAKLQEIIQALAAEQGITLTSMENLQAVSSGGHRRIALRLSLTAPFPVLIRLLQAVVRASPRMAIDDLQVESPRLLSQPVDPPLEVHVTVFGFRAAASDG